MISEYRSNLLRLVLEFIQSTYKINGVLRIALIGSLMTNKKNPKDADLLITITDNLDLTQLAKRGRRLQGKASSISSGADIFLLNEKMDYIGRICHWKECRPGVRMSCDALNCGKREYLHDDLQVINLSKNLVVNPPLIIFPDLVKNADIPVDVEEEIIKKIILTDINKST